MHVATPAPRRAAVLAALAATALLSLVPSAGADPQIPWSGDERATPSAGVAASCAAAGLGGQVVEATVTKNSRYLNVTAVASGIALTGVVVQGGPGYNTYPASAFSGLPWTRLHAPLESPSQPDKPAPHTGFFACGATTPPTSTTTSTTTTRPTTTTVPTTTSTVPTTTGSSPTSTSGTTTPPPVTTSTTPGLAETGYDRGWLVFLAAGLVLLGAAALALPRLLRRRG
ncbi:hypothetical protein JOF53_005581 [Crossiella equi]|uniref:Gram-positive cocci surface proteins LPxTG domain-containing protein n=1 Tax=Crossiella equi TaxID=130796 RepID=A0ABS5AKG9_9PSEU|nr:hypothetical protein [Crossiella equi]MBP2476709.1 hypothetical protein [Crossiella equi]